MERRIQDEQAKTKEVQLQKDQAEKENQQMVDQVKEIEQILEKKDEEMKVFTDREAQLQREIAQMGRMNEDIEKTLTLMKAKEYDKVDLFRKVAETEAKMKYL